MNLGAIVVTMRLGKFVGIRCAKGRGIIFPGGKIEPGENLREAARRECFEETGLKVEDLEWVYGGPAGDGFYTTAFYARDSGNGILVSSDEGDALLAEPAEFLASKFGDYYETLFAELKRRGIR